MSFNLTDASTWPTTAEPDPEWESLVKALGGTAPDLGLFPDIPSLRKFLADSKANLPATVEPIPGVKEEDRQITVRDGAQITVRIHSPEEPAAGGGPLGVMYHGGGWCIGDLTGEELLCRHMVSKFNMTVVNVDYRLGPEYQFPIAHNDCFDATKWAASNASSLGADPAKGFILGGTSAGGNLAATISHLWRDDALSPKITGCHLMIPSVCAPDYYPQNKDIVSWDQLKSAPILGRTACNLFFDNYIPKIADRQDPIQSPLLWKSGHKGLPPQVFQICGMDPLRDEALVYERELREEDGVKTKVWMYPGFPHGFWSIFPQLEASKRFVEESVQGIGWLLEQK